MTKIVCPGCGVECMSFLDLGYHVDGFHARPSSETDWVCFCGERFRSCSTSADSLAVHLRDIGTDNLKVHWVQSRLRGVASP